MSFQYKCSVGNLLREQHQEARETISEMQFEIDNLVKQRDDAMDIIEKLYEYYRRRIEYFEKINGDLVFQRDQAMEDIKELLPQYEIWRRRAEYWQARYTEEINNAHHTTSLEKGL